MANTKIVLNRQSDLALDNALITNPQGIVLNDISGVSEAVASINEAASVAISTEASDRVAGDLSLTLDLSAEASARAAAVSGEAAARLEGDVSVTAAMTAEISSRIVAETSLQNNIDAEASLRVADVDAEESRAVAAEGSLAANLSSEASRAIAAELSLNTKVEFVISNVDDAAIDSLTEIIGAFQSADGDINNAITTLANAAGSDLSAEVSTRLAGDESLAADLSSEIVDRAAAVSLEEVARISADTSVALDLSAEIEARVSDVNEEQARAESAEASLDDAKLNLAGGTMSGNIDMGNNLITNTLAVIASAVKINDLSSDNTNINLFAGLDANSTHSIINLPAPTADGDAANKLYVDSADASIAAELSSEVSARLDAGSSISAELSISVSDRVAADESLASEIESLALTDETTIELNTADNTIKLKDTIAAPASGVRTFEGEVNVNSILRVGDVDVMATLSTEVSRAESAEAALDAAKLNLAGGTMSGTLNMGGNYIDNVNIIASQSTLTVFANDGVMTMNNTDINLNGNDIEAVNTITVNTSLDLNNNGKVVNLPAPTADGDAANKLYVDSEVSTEVARAESAELSLNTKIEFVISNVDDVALDSLTEIVAAFQSADGDLNGAITALASTGTSGLSNEVARAMSAEALLTADLSSEVLRAMAAESDLEDALATERDIRNNADIAEASLRVAGDLSLANALSSEASLRVAAVDAEESRAVAAEGSLAAILSSEVSRAEAAEASLAEELSSEVSYLISNIDITDVDSFSEIVRDLSSEILRAESADASLEAAKLNLAGGTMSGGINMGGFPVDNVSSLTVELIQGFGPQGVISLYANIDGRDEKTIINLPAPTNGGDAANKTYVDAADAALAADFANIYAKHVGLNETPDDSIATFTLATAVREGSELVYVNGLLFDSEDYTVNLVNGKVASVTFVIIPSVGDKVRAYGVY